MSDKKFATDYIDVATRIAEVRGEADKHYPEGSFQPLDHAQPYRLEVIDGQAYIVYVAAFYRTPDDTRPGVGSAWEVVPGKSNFTRGSELQNAETSAWGRALVATLAADTKRGIASAEEVRNRQADREQPLPAPDAKVSAENALALIDKCEALGLDPAKVVDLGTAGRTDDPALVLKSEVANVKKAMEKLASAVPA